MLTVDVKRVSVRNNNVSKMHTRVRGDIKVKYMLPQNRPRRPRGGVEAKLYSFFDLGARWGGWSTPRPGQFTPGKDPVPIV